MVSYLDGMLRYFEFFGRSSRMQYFMFFAVQLLLTGLGLAIDHQVQGAISPQLSRMPVTLFMLLVHIVPAVTVQVRRLHDVGRSGLWYLLTFLPLGTLVLLYWALQPSHGGIIDAAPALPARRQPASTIPSGVRLGNTVRGSELVEGRFI